MTRSLSTEVQSVVASTEVRPFLIFEGEFWDAVGGTPDYVRAWSGLGDLSWDSKTWIGTGTLISITDVKETQDNSANGITVTLNGVPSDLISLALQSIRQGKIGTVWLGFMNESNTIVDSPILLFQGRLDIPSIDEDGENCAISITYESRLIDLKRPREARYTDQYQQDTYPGDLGCNFVASIQEINLVWGRK